jgi:5-methylcytosine-specific restriction endonuclease McrA
MHWKRAARAAGTVKNDPWSDRRRANYQRRRALKKGADAERISTREVYARDAWTCGLCSEPVDELLAWPDPRSASLDHILPLSKGGPHAFANVQLAHLGCNVEKGNRVA